MFRFVRPTFLGVLFIISPALALAQPEEPVPPKYGVRQDPLFLGIGKELGDETYELDRPGLLPLMSMKDLANPRHPYRRGEKVERFLRDPLKLSAEHRNEFEQALDKLFGTPLKPKMNVKGKNVDHEGLTTLKVGEDRLEHGAKLYRTHCLHCHGVTGDGRGRTAPWVNPHPRDFRRGLFKFYSVDGRGQMEFAPSRADLIRTLQHGIEGTAMPAFDMLSNVERESVVSYVIHLSIRGATEFTYLKEEWAEQGNVLRRLSKDSIADELFFWAEFVTARWVESQDTALTIQPVKYPYDPKDVNALAASVKRGQQIYLAKISPEFKSEQALKMEARTILQRKWDDALQKKRTAARIADPNVDDFGIQLSAAEKDAQKLTDAESALAAKRALDPISLQRAEAFLRGANCISCHSGVGREHPYRFDIWGAMTRAGSYTSGVFRGGKQPVDIYYRIHGGILASGMTPYAQWARGYEEYIWDLVNFVTHVPDPEMRQKLGIQLD